jgi:hypothetical protein
MRSRLIINGSHRRRGAPANLQAQLAGAAQLILASVLGGVDGALAALPGLEVSAGPGGEELQVETRPGHDVRRAWRGR